MKIALNQVGYRPQDIKRATVRIGDIKDISDSNVLKRIEEEIGEDDRVFRVVNSESGETVYEGEIADIRISKASKEINAICDFTPVSDNGQYYIDSPCFGKSYRFEISDAVYEDLLTDVARMFYLQRCGCELTEKYAGKYAHKECHNTKARIYGTDEYIDVTGGWHDAGDYGRYIVAAAKAVADLMLSYEYFEDIFSKSFNIPESGNGIPDILDEIKYELDWMMKMQAENGSVYHKVTCASFPGFVMPEEETEELIVCPASDTATADFAASMAMAYRIYSGLEEKYGSAADDYVKAAEEYLKAARKAMEFLEHDSASEFLNPEGVVTGEYGDSRTIDEIFWANAEMFKTTGDKKYEKALLSMNLDEVPGEMSWKEVGDYGFYAYITAPFDKDEAFYKAVYKRFEDEAAAKLDKYNADPYGSSIYGYYYWGCNMEMANDTMRAIILDKMNDTDIYKDMIKAQLDYLLGNNPCGKSFVTGYGENSPENPHHRPSAAVGAAMPGMLVGGPEPLLLDEITKKTLKDVPDSKCYLDHLESYSTNEITIYWNSPLVFLLAYICSQ